MDKLFTKFKIAFRDIITTFRRRLRMKRKGIKEFFLIIRQPIYHRIALSRVKLKFRKNVKIKIVFVVIHSSVWKYDSVYNHFKNDSRFEPVIIICPVVNYGKDNMLQEMELAYKQFRLKGFNVIKSYNSQTDGFMDINFEIKPDIIFFTNPHLLTLKQYYITSFYKTLTCYVPYGFKNSYLYEDDFNKLFQNLLWKFYLETEIHKKLAEKYSRIRGRNSIVTGFPGMEIVRPDTSVERIWKTRNQNIKRIIWAPHHTIPGKGETLDFSTFLKYSDFMLELAEKYIGVVEIAFKPHPVLRPKLSLSNVWGKEKTEQYYKRWQNLANGSVHEGDYVNLFYTSNAMMHDSSSFVVEYLYVGNPVLYLMSDENVTQRFNEVGKMAFTTFYIARNRSDIETFIQDVVIKGNDRLKPLRLDFYNQYLIPPNNNLASVNIYQDIINSLS